MTSRTKVKIAEIDEHLSDSGRWEAASSREDLESVMGVRRRVAKVPAYKPSVASHGTGW